MTPGHYTSTTHQRSTITRQGSLAAVLRELADEIDRDEAAGVWYNRIAVRSTDTIRGMRQFSVRVDRQHRETRLPAGVAGICPVCRGHGVAYDDQGKKDHPLNVWDDDAKRHRCIRCGGTGYLMTEDAAPVSAAS
jgi:hypothetical protein